MKRYFVLLALPLLLLPLTGISQYFTDATANLPIQTQNTWTMDAEAADLDQDGDLDIVIANEFRENYVLFNDGNGIFSVDPNRRLPRAEPNASYFGQDSEDIAITDFDGDGDLDILFVSEDTPKHEFLLNDSTGKFTFATWQFPGSNANGLAVADFDGDNLPDVLIGNKGQNQLYFNLGNNTFADSTATFPINLDWTQDLKVMDLDNDGDLDILEGIESGGNNLYFNDGTGKFTEESFRLPIFVPNMETRKMTLEDVNGDSFPDIFVSNVGWTQGPNPQDRIYLNQGNATWQDATNNALPIDSKTTLEGIFYDVDRDGDPDLLRAGQSGILPYLYETLLNDGQGNFQTTTLPVFPNSSAITCLGILKADFNRDGWDDIFFGGHQTMDRLYFYDSTYVPVSVKSGELSTIKWGPNPVKNQLHLMIPEGISGELAVKILDMNGKTIYAETWGKAVQVEITTQNWPKGIYWVQIQFYDQLWQAKVVKIMN